LKEQLPGMQELCEAVDRWLVMGGQGRGACSSFGPQRVGLNVVGWDCRCVGVHWEGLVRL